MREEEKKTTQSNKSIQTGLIGDGNNHNLTVQNYHWNILSILFYMCVVPVCACVCVRARDETESRV